MARKQGIIQTNFLKGFGKLRKEFKKYSSLGLINQIVIFLYHNFELKSQDQLGKAPWAQLLLIKWILIDPDFGRSSKDPTQDQAIKVMEMAMKLQDKTRLPSDYPNLFLFMRSIVYQQAAPYQNNIALTQLARQKLLFSTLPDNHPLTALIRKEFGLSIDVILELSLSVLVRYMKNPSSTFNVDYFSAINCGYPLGTVEKYLALISADIGRLRKYLYDKSPPGRMVEEYNEQSPLSQLPLIHINNVYVCWYPTMLFRCLETFVFDKLRAKNPDNFMPIFGSIFEKYVENSLVESSLQYFPEKTIKPLIGDAKCVDFIITENHSITFVDAKGVEMPAEAKTAHDPNVIKKRVGHTIVKAIEQAYSTLNNLDRLSSVIDQSYIEKIPYALVVTYKEHYLGNGLRFSDSVAKDEMATIKANYPNCDIPLENIFFVNIEELDSLCEAVRQGKTTLTRMFEFAKEADLHPETSCFTFSQHLHREKCSYTPEWLRTEVETMMDKLTSLLQKEVPKRQT